MTKTATPSSAHSLIAAPPRVINIGLEAFAADLSANGVDVQQVVWTPPARGDAALARLLAKLGS